MRPWGGRFSLCLLLLPCLAAGGAEAETREELGWWTERTLVEVGGESQERAASPTYRLSVRFEAGVGGLPFEALRIYAEPGRQLLFEQVDPAFAKGQPVGPGSHAAVASLQGELGHLHHRLNLPFELGPGPGGRIVVELTWAGRPVVVADAWVDLSGFEIATRFRQSHRGGESPQVFEHCCRGKRCEMICATCSGPGFFCDLGTCEIECIDF